MTSTAEQIVALRERAGKATQEVARQEAMFESSETALAAAEKALRDAGLDPDGDLDAQVAEKEQVVKESLAGVETQLTALTAEAEPRG